MQRRKLDRNARPRREPGAPGRVADGANGVRVGLEIALGVFRGARAFAKHVEGEELATSCSRLIAASMVSPKTKWPPISLIA